MYQNIVKLSKIGQAKIKPRKQKDKFHHKGKNKRRKYKIDISITMLKPIHKIIVIIYIFGIEIYFWLIDFFVLWYLLLLKFIY